MIEVYILFLITFLLGYYLGTKRSVTDDLSTGYTQIKKGIKKLTDEEVKVGAIRRPDIQKIQHNQIPDKQKEGIRAMEETLKDIPELNV